ncbi:hypothetical protein HDF22_005070 [Mucilaginibacter lappiensis]|uniref:mannosyl-glycoprotein endo-beta-N-acetylglucosaminidase n=1 Tax=Mucilaginibacter lappiensis TaxID=354630 RepID=A0A841JKD7_9SPHI|nr:hypothetical protein [Mucilaginibacter lappiensis]
MTYKKGKHQLFLGYLVADGNDPKEAYNMLNVPDSVDIVEAFAGYDTVSTHWRALQLKGTKIVICSFPKSDAFFDGSFNDGNGLKPLTKFDKPTANSTYDHWARAMHDKYITQMGWDGIDIDIETGTFGNEAPAENAASLLQSVAKYFGPKANIKSKTRAGVRPLFLYDTDVDTEQGESLSYGKIYKPYKSNYSFVVFQSYIGGSRRWKGSAPAHLDPLLNAFDKDKLIILTNGDEWVYPNGTQDNAPDGDQKASKWLFEIADWGVKNKIQGIGAYRMSRDYNHKPSFSVTRKAIQLINPATP